MLGHRLGDDRVGVSPSWGCPGGCVTENSHIVGYTSLETRSRTEGLITLIRQSRLAFFFIRT